ncbi:hypothetical protein [Mycobacterium szulgai]|nr:hypothetical protein [Mycobacterium szulgai]
MSSVGTRLESLEPAAGELHSVLHRPAASKFALPVVNTAIEAVAG